MYALVFVLATLMFIPASPLTVMAGFIFGPVWGAMLISPAGILSARIAFSFGRSIGRARMQKILKRHPRLLSVDEAVARDGFSIIFLLRLASVVPFSPLNYMLGASQVSARSFTIASWLGLLPGTFLYAYVGSSLSNASQIFHGDLPETPATRVMAWLGLLAAFLVLMIFSFIARKALRSSLGKNAA